MEKIAEIEQATQLAGRGARLGASLVDCGVLLVFMGPIAYFLGVFDYAKDQQQPPLSLTLLIGAIGIAIFLVVNWKLLNQNAQTVGKYFLDLRIANLDGSKPTLKQLMFRRYLVYWGFPYIPMVGGLLNLINILFIFRKDRRCIHDLYAGTKVING